MRYWSPEKTKELAAYVASMDNVALNAATHPQANTDTDRRAAAAIERISRILEQSHKVERGTSGLGLYKVDGQYVHIEINEDYTGSSRWSAGKRSGKLRIIVGDYGDKTQYPEGKAGFSFDKIAKKLEAGVAIRVARREREAKASANRTQSQELVDALKAKLDIATYSSLIEPSSADGGNLVRVKFEKSMTVEQAELLLQAVKDLGLSL